MAKVSKLTLIEDRDKSICVIQQQARNNTTSKIWLPRSQISYLRKLGMSPADRALGKKQEITLEIPDWLADEKGLDYE